ncbi:MAG: DUF4080 domain-containing protein [Bacteroidales bacterium]|nr:DUF4080 domain-containing protein [Bacteroidales bacterium]
MRILWLDINASYSHSSLAIPALHAQLSKSIEEIHSWRVVSGSINRETTYYLTEISDFSPDIILSTLWLFNHKKVLSVLERAKALSPNIRIILGGPEFLGDNKDFLNKNRFTEAIFRGEGEDIFPEFIANIESVRSYSNISGFCYIDEQGLYIDNGVAIVANFSQLNPPESSPLFDWNKPFVQIETSRGCFNRCSFCISGDERKVDNIPLESLESRFDNILHHNVNEVRILDRTFNANAKRAAHLLKLFKKYSPYIQFHLEVHPSLLDVNLREILEDLPNGLLHIEAGVQSFEESVLKSCNRFGSSKDTAEGVRFLRSLGKFEVHCDLIAALPHYTYREILNDTLMLIELYPHEIQLEVLKLLPGTEMTRNASAFNIKYSPTPPYEALETPWISFNELRLSSALSKILDSYYNNVVWRGCFRSVMLENRDFLEHFTLHYSQNSPENNINNESRGLYLYNYAKINYQNALIHIILCWMENGFSNRTGPGLLSKQWRFGEQLHNPIFDLEDRNSAYRYVEYDSKRYWFKHTKNSNSYKSISNFIEIL